MGTKSEIQAAAYRAEERERVKIDLPPSPEPSVARVTLEFSGQLRAPPSQWPWDLILSGACIVRSEPGESVRVVEECCLDRINMGEVIRQRDAAIREREEFRRSFLLSEEANTLICDERDTLRARVVELEAAVADCNILLGDRWREAVSAVTGKAAPAASDAAGTEVVSAEAVAWGVMVHRDAAVLCVPFTVIEAADHFVRLNGVNERMQVVPLYAAPQPAKGWLTPEQREAIMYLIANRSQFAPQTPHEERRNAASRVCHDILARSSPPEVVAPKYVETHDAFRNCAFKVRDADWRAALAAAGVTVKEVG